MADARPKRSVSRVNYGDVADVRLPRSFRGSRKNTCEREESKLYRLRVLEEDGDSVKVSYIGYGSQYDEWRPRTEVVLLDGNEDSSDESECDISLAPVKPFCLYKELACRIKSLLLSYRKGDPVCCITMSFDSIYFDGLIRRGSSLPSTSRQPKQKKYTLPSLTKFDDILGGRWYIRGLNEAGDFCYVKPGTVNFHLKYNRGKVDYQWKPDGTLKSSLFGEGFQLVFKFISEDGTSSQWNNALKLCQN